MDDASAINKQRARIEDWEVVALWGTQVLIGRVVDHPRQWEFVGSVQQTSGLLWIDEAAGVAETRNTIYTLGRKAA